MAWDVDRSDWRTFRLDRMSDVRETTWGFRPRDHPDPVTHVQESVGVAPYAHRVRVRLHCPVESARARIPAAVGTLTPIDADTCELYVGSDSLEWPALHLARLDVGFEVVEPAELADVLYELGRRMLAAAGTREHCGDT